MKEIRNYKKYIELLKNGSLDKLFFCDKIFGEWKTLVDYGCADGSITKLIAEVFPDKMITGYDNDESMINIALNTGSKPMNANFVNLRPTTGDVLNLSSVLHEVYAYLKPEEIQEFWDYVYKSGFKYIIIRDMLYNRNQDFQLIFSNIQLRDTVKNWCEKNHCLGEFMRFEEVYGPTDQPVNMVHFLLKYSYMTSPNWERELFENYMGLSLNELISDIPDTYRIIYKDTYGLPFLEYKWRQDFNFNIHIRTHGKIILEKTNY